MRRKKIWVVTLMAFMVLALPALAQKGKKPKKGTIPVTVTFRGIKGVFLTPPDRIKSDLLGTYTDNGNITSSSGKFRFGLRKPRPNKPAKRKLFLDFSDCDSGPCIRPSTFDLVTFSSLVGAAGAVNFHTKGIDLREMAVGEFRDDLGLAVGFDLQSIDGGLWTFRFNFDFADCPDVPASTPITVNRTAADTWVIEADPTSDLACLGEVEGGASSYSAGYTTCRS